MRRFVAVLIAAELLTAGGLLGVREYRGTTHVTTAGGTTGSTTTTTPEGFTEVPAAGQTLVRGRVTSITGDGITPPSLKLPLALDEQNRGETQATFRAVVIDGRRTNVYWNGGRPLPLTGTGGLDLFPSGGTQATIDPGGFTWELDGATRQLVAGTYTTGFTVGVGTGGLPTPHDDPVTFTADDRSSLTTRGGAIIHQPPAALKITGPGSLTFMGALVLRTATGTRSATTVHFGPGPFVVDLTPVAGGYAISATLQGPVS
ncbi:MAG: hypothetical protein JOZ37_20725 [Actinobacteria bacterium]|nr:hypothetical protein [Actinomycetota bacterium]MBV9935594.1 hypothetical protein [Actinomycetota bacterium]